MSSSEWTTVTKNDKKRVANRSRRRPRPSDVTKLPPSLASTSSSSLSVPQMKQALQELIDKLLQSSFYENLKKSLEKEKSISQIVCYGIGNFWSNQSAPLWQLACALAIRSSLQVPMHYFDPCMSTQESELLLSKDVLVISENEKGKRLVNSPTFFFMPHCPMMLYTNVLHTNWNHLEHVILLGNSLSTYANRLEERSSGGVKLLQVLQPHWNEQALFMSKEDLADMPGYFEKGFNDSVLISFEKQKDDVSWPEPPELNDNDEASDEVL
jgi:hypothetical protein